MFSRFAEYVYNLLSQIPFDLLVWIAWGSFAALFLACLVLCFTVKRVKEADKRPFLSLVNAYSAVTLAIFLTGLEIGPSIFVAAIFWAAGYLMYGALCALSRKKQPLPPSKSLSALAEMPMTPPKSPPQDLPSAKTGVRLEHALSVIQKLLSKNLGKGDRQEIEKMRNTLSVLRIKGTLTPAETDILNENFNVLLKLMAKYNL